MMVPNIEESYEGGLVHRVGTSLTVEPPARMPASTWLVLEQELLLHADAVSASNRVVAVPVQQAHKLLEILRRPWPAGRWNWAWSPSAEAAAERATEIHQRVARVMASDNPTSDETASMLGDLLEGGFTRTLLPSQSRAVSALVQAEGGGNFSVPGSGKTTMTYATYTALRQRGCVDRMIVIAPQSAYEAWQEEIQDCFRDGMRPTIEVAPRAPRRSSEVVVFNYERAAQGGTRAAIDGWARGHRMLVVFDEAHRAKRAALGEHGRGAIDLAEMAFRRLVLTGTPMPNGIGDLEAMLDLAWPGAGRLLIDPNTSGAERTWVRIAKDQLELNPAVVTTKSVVLDDAHQRIYDAVASRLAGNVSAIEARPDLLKSATTRLIAAASNPALLANRGDQEMGWRDDSVSADMSLVELLAVGGRGMKPAKLLAAASLARDHAARGEKLLVWTNFLGNVSALERLMAPYNPAVVTGSLARDSPNDVTDRRRELQKFREDPTCGVLIATPQSLGEGVSLHRVCQSQVHVDRSYNAGLFLQAIDRTHRVGMPEGTTAKVTILVSAGTIDEDVDTALKRKLLEMDETLCDPTLRHMTESTEDSVQLTANEIADLISHIA